MSARKQLEDLIAHLREAIGKSDEEREREELARLADQLDRRVEEDDDEGIVDELRDEVTKFESSHPSLADAIGRAADALSALGL